MYMSKKVGKHFLLDPELIEQARKILRVKTQTEAIQKALEEAIQRAKFEQLVHSSKGKYRFQMFDFGSSDESPQGRNR